MRLDGADVEAAPAVSMRRGEIDGQGSRCAVRRRMVGVGGGQEECLRLCWKYRLGRVLPLLPLLKVVVMGDGRADAAS